MRKLLFLILFLPTVAASAQITLPRLISDNAVLQRDTELTLFGWASPKEKVVLDLRGKRYTATTSDQGKWSILLPKQEAGGPFEMVITGKNQITLRNILFGDVWLCSGQSNMELTMDRVKERYAKEIETSANRYIRHFEVPDKYDFKNENEDVAGGVWKEADPANVLRFSAVAYFFARNIYEKHSVPVGLINAALGGSPAEAWISEDALKKFPQHLAEAKRFRNDSLIDAVETFDRKRITEWYAELAKKDIGVKERLSAASIDLNDGAQMNIPGYWADNGVGNMNGAVWFTRTFNVPETMAGKVGKIELGRVVDQDSVFINGKFVGATSYQYPPRRYAIQPGVLKSGTNRITIRVINQSGRGGFVPDKPYYIAVAGDTINLKGRWNYKVGATMSMLPAQTFIRWKPLGLFNAMIAPLTKFPIRGVIWYQGESNTGAAKEYELLFPALINDWRQRWNHEFPFIFVQLANFMARTRKPAESDWATLRESQRKTLRLTNTGMVVAIDAGEWNDIHPENKKVIGERLALQARKLTYGEQDLVASGPHPASALFEKNSVTIRFDHAQNGLTSYGGPLRYFELSGDGKHFVNAKAEIIGDTVVVTSDEVSEVRAVRYAWADNPDTANLYNQDGLPATPFELKK